jgi:hypothetical protein
LRSCLAGSGSNTAAFEYLAERLAKAGDVKTTRMKLDWFIDEIRELILQSIAGRKL